MPAELVRESDTELVVQVTIKKSSNFYECEKNIRGALNEGGSLATGKCLEDFDADGSPIVMAVLVQRKWGFCGFSLTEFLGLSGLSFWPLARQW